jgi:predicted AlkP superfamily pyrophosphatase or phosphodiesterase
MKKKLLVVQVAALAHDFKIEGITSRTMQSVFPALTCTAQASFRTAALPETHGMIANGLYQHNLQRPMFWEQSSRLVQGARIWEDFRKQGKRVAMLFWQQSLGENADFILSPAPIHKHHGGMIQAFYSKPDGLYERICREIGRPFKLQRYWGPLASSKVGDWIVKATSIILENKDMAPDLCLTYLPTLDYDLQRNDPENSAPAAKARLMVEGQLAELMRSAIEQSYDVVIFGDYRIKPVSEAVMPNLALRNTGLMMTREIKGMAYPDFYSGKAFAMVDHEIAHIYVKDKSDTSDVYDVLSKLKGVGEILDKDAQAKIGLSHDNSGDLVIVAEQGKWFAYPWWADKNEAPEFAGHVDIHNKPGYDPCELFFGWPPGTVSMNVSRIRGSHGRTGPGRHVTWASTVPAPDKISDLIDLSRWTRERLEEDL